MAPDFDPGVSSASSEHDKLFAGHAERVTRNITIESGAGVVTRGALVGRITANGKYVLSDDGAADGSETPVAILVDDVDATAADADGAAYFTGEFNENEVQYGGAHTAATVREALAARGLFLKTTVQA